MTKQGDLPGMEDRRIKDLHEAAEKWLALDENKTRAARLAKEANEDMVKLMRRHKRETYRCNGILITIKPGKDTALVKEVEDEEASKEQREVAEAVKETKGKPN